MNAPPAPIVPSADKMKKLAFKRKKSMHVLLVIDGNPKNNWYEIFSKCAGPDGEPMQVEQTSWDLLHVKVKPEEVTVTISPSPDPIYGTSQKYERTIVPDFILVRNFVLGIHGVNYLNTLMGLRIGNIPAVNSLDSIFFSTQRAVMIGEMRKIQQALGEDVFPVVPISYFPNVKENIVCHEYPMVCKVGTSHAGYGKMKFEKEDFEDFSTLMAMYNDYVTIEPFVPNIGDVRVQMIGKHVRAFRRITTGWKGNVGEAEVEDIPADSEEFKMYKTWCNEACKMYGGIDILSIDAVIDEKGKHTVLEINDTATGLNPMHAEEDTRHIRDLVLIKMEENYCNT